MSYHYNQHFQYLGSHNDYLQTNSFTDAFNLGIYAIEVDVFLKSGVLRVGHDSTSATSGPTLAAEYLDLIADLTISERQLLRLAVELKDNPSNTAFTALITLLDTYSEFSDGSLSIVILGNQPSAPTTHPSWVTFTGNGRTLSVLQDSEVSEVGIEYDDYFTWNGSGTAPPEVYEHMKIFADTAHAHGKRLRIVHAPETTGSWQVQYDAGCDIIDGGGDHPPGADDITGLAAWFNSL